MHVCCLQTLALPGSKSVWGQPEDSHKWAAFPAWPKLQTLDVFGCDNVSQETGTNPATAFQLLQRQLQGLRLGHKDQHSSYQIIAEARNSSSLQFTGKSAALSTQQHDKIVGLKLAGSHMRDWMLLGMQTAMCSHSQLARLSYRPCPGCRVYGR